MLTDIQKRVLKKVVQTLNENKIPYQISGGLAAIAYGSKRPLYDIDIDIYKKDIRKVKELFSQYVVEKFHHAQRENFDMYIMALNIKAVHIDITQAEEFYVINKDGQKLRMDVHLEKAKIMNIEGIEISIEDKDELLVYKKILGRDVDLIDIEQISKSR